tara:strand:- start:97 stop:573 length:477 start_codon:yes stop_codon:yes gene_type:complete
MFLLSVKNTFLIILFIFLQLFFPDLFLFYDFYIGIDFLLILLTILVFQFSTYKIIFLSFFLGLVVDYTYSINQIGLLALLTSFSIYLIGFIKQYQFIWNLPTKLIALFLISFLIGLSNYFLICEEFYFITFYVSSINSMIYTAIIFLVNKYFYNYKLI